MRFIQIIESEGDVAEELAGVQGYAEQAAGDETVKVERVTICGDRDRPGTVIMIAEFASADAAKQNDEHEITQEGAANAPDDQPQPARSARQSDRYEGHSRSPT